MVVATRAASAPVKKRARIAGLLGELASDAGQAQPNGENTPDRLRPTANNR